jgi:hypothetical protein
VDTCPQQDLKILIQQAADPHGLENSYIQYNKQKVYCLLVIALQINAFIVLITGLPEVLNPDKQKIFHQGNSKTRA